MVSFERAFGSGQWWRATNGVWKVVPSPWSGYSEGTVTQCWPLCRKHHQVGWCDWAQTTPWFHHRTDCLLTVAQCHSADPCRQRYTSTQSLYRITFDHPQGRIKALRGPRPKIFYTYIYIYTWEATVTTASLFSKHTRIRKTGNNPKHFFTLFVQTDYSYYSYAYTFL